MPIITLAEATYTLQRNHLVAIPTETVYGLAGNGFHEGAVQKIFEWKKRPLFNPLILHIKNEEYLNEVAQDIPEVAHELAKCFWPGPLTLILKKRSHVPDIVTAGQSTVAVRIPHHEMTLALLHLLDFPLAAPSANPFGSISPTAAAHVEKYFGERGLGILDGGVCDQGLESTIIGFNHDKPILYRYGSLASEEIEKITGPLHIHHRNDSSPVAPGMLSRHYAPNTTTYLSDHIPELIQSFDGLKIGLLLFAKPFTNFPVHHQEILSPSGQLNEAARNLYAAMHRLDLSESDVIIAERFPNTGLGITINDKLERATKK